MGGGEEESGDLYEYEENDDKHDGGALELELGALELERRRREAALAETLSSPVRNVFNGFMGDGMVPTQLLQASQTIAIPYEQCTVVRQRHARSLIGRQDVPYDHTQPRIRKYKNNCIALNNLLYCSY